jgi:hypothetical protein
MKKNQGVSVIPDVSLNRAQALDKSAVVRLRFDPAVAKQVTNAGVAFIAPHRATLAKDHPGFDLVAFDALPMLCDRILDLKAQLDESRRVRGVKPRDLIARALEWRRKLMPLAETLAATGKLDGDRLARIHAGAGSVDNVRDVIDLVALLDPHRAMAEDLCGANAFTLATDAANQARAAMNLGDPDSEASTAAGDLRDRYATLVEQDHDHLRIAVATLTSYRKAEAIVGSLTTRVGSGKASTPPEPVPGPAVGPA